MIKADRKILKTAAKVGYRVPAREITARRETRGEMSRNLELLERVRDYYSAMYDLRRRRMRSRKFYRGDQWSDYVEVNGQMIKEEDYIRMQGKPALKQNMIRPRCATSWASTGATLSNP